MMVLAGTKRVLIVTAAEFLKHWGETHYGTNNPAVRYVSKREFLEMKPD